MKKSILILTSFLLSASFFAQKKSAEKGFPVKVEGTISNYHGKYIYLHHKWNEKDFTDSARLKDGKFSFSLRSPEPNMYWFTIVNDINHQPNYIFFADAVPLKAKLKGD